MVGVDVMQDNCEKFVDGMAVDSAPLVMKNLSTIISNILSQPSNEKYRTIPTSNKIISNVLKEDPRALEYLELLGFQRSASGKEYTLKPGSEDLQALSAGLQVLKKNLSTEEAPKEYDTSSKFDGFNVFETKVDNLGGAQIQHAGVNYSLEQKIQNIKKEREDALHKVGIPERELVIFDSDSKPVKLSNLPENYSKKVDISILKEMADSNQKKAVKAEQFQTKAMRELEQLNNTRVYPKTVIHVQFPDGLIVRANFSPLERISDVEAQVKLCMEQPEKFNFGLYAPPSTKKLDARSTLAELKVGAGQKFRAKWEGDQPEGEYMLDSLMSQESTAGKPKRKSLFSFGKN